MKDERIPVSITMRPYLFVAATLLVAVNLLLGFPRALGLAENSLARESVPANVVTAQGEVAGVSKQVCCLQTRGKKQPLPVSSGIPAPVITANAALAEDLDTGTILFVKDPDKRVAIASTTKIMTAIVASSYFHQNDILTAPDDILTIDGSSMGLKPGEKLTFRSLLYGMLLNSGNDAAFAIAANFPGGLPAFIQAMNQEAAQMNLENTHFDNPAGFDSPNHYSTASDLAKIAAAAMENSEIARVVSTKETEVVSVDKSIVHPLTNLNKLLGEPGVLGIKTGTTPAAKENFVGEVQRNNHKILTVVLGSDDRYGDTQKLFDWTFQNFTWQ